MKKYSLFIGRWQPPHKGHCRLIQKVLNEGNDVLVACRVTEVNEDNPYTFKERKHLLREMLPDKNRVKIIPIPDIKEVCYGRKVGWGIRRIRLEKYLEEISASQIRGAKKHIIWLTGNVGAGKTSLAYLLKERLNNVVILDGDEMRASISLGAGFSQKDRHEHNLRVARLAKVLYTQGFNVIVSVIAPFRATRKEVTKLIDPFWIYIKSDVEDKDKPYEPPKKPDLIIDPKKEDMRVSLERIVKKLRKVE